MRLRKRHAWSAALIALFALPVIRPEGFPALEGRVDGWLGWPARFGVGNPHEWTAESLAAGGEGDARASDIWQMYLSDREKHYELMDELTQHVQLADTLKDFQRKPLAIPARVLRAHDASGPRRSLLIDRGTEDGIVAGQPVVIGRVLVGLVTHVDAHSARVQRLTDPYTRLEVAVRTSDGVRQTAYLHGGSDDELALHNLRGVEGLHVRPGDAVVTSNANENVPAGLVVGTVVSASDDDADAILSVRIRPAADLARSTIVLVLASGS